jgi:hypothetical protein
MFYAVSWTFSDVIEADTEEQAIRAFSERAGMATMPYLTKDDVKIEEAEVRADWMCGGGQ